VRSNEPELLKKIGGGDWSDETIGAVDAAVKQFAEDFGYDLDEEGHPLEDEAEPRSRSKQNGSSSEEDSEEEEQRDEAEAEAQPA